MAGYESDAIGIQRTRDRQALAPPRRADLAQGRTRDIPSRHHRTQPDWLAVNRPDLGSEHAGRVALGRGCAGQIYFSLSNAPSPGGKVTLTLFPETLTVPEPSTSSMVA